MSLIPFTSASAVALLPVPKVDVILTLGEKPNLYPVPPFFTRTAFTSLSTICDIADAPEPN